MRVLQVCPYDWHAPGGVQMHVRHLTAALRQRGHDVQVIAPAHRPADEPWVRVIGRPRAVRFNGSSAPICPDPRAGIELRGVLRAHAPDIVHAHEPLAPSLGLYAGLFSSAPVVGTFHAHCVTPVGRLCYAVATWPVNWRLAAGIAVSRAATASLTRGVRVPFRIVPNGVDADCLALARVPIRPGPRRLLFAHRLEPRKGLATALRAFARLADEFPTLELVVVGDGDDAGLVQHLPEAVRRRVRMPGTLPRADLLAQLTAADVFLAPAIGGESFGMVLLEAMAASLPVVASRIQGYNEVVRDGIDGLLFPPGDADALSAVTARLLREPDLAARLGRAGRARAASYSWDRIAGEVERLYDSLAVPSPRASARGRIAAS